MEKMELEKGLTVKVRYDGGSQPFYVGIVENTTDKVLTIALGFDKYRSFSWGKILEIKVLSSELVVA